MEMKPLFPYPNNKMQSMSSWLAFRNMISDKGDTMISNGCHIMRGEGWPPLATPFGTGITIRPIALAWDPQEQAEQCR